VTFVKRPIGVSTAYEDLGKFFWSCVEGKPPAPGIENMLFVGGLVAGAKLVAYAVPEILESFSPERSISLPAALVGGFSLIFGARLAGGCTSGHGLSGMASMGISSFISVPCMFAGGILTAILTRA